MPKPEVTEEEIKAIARALFNPKPMNKAEAAAAKSAMKKMSDWETMTHVELDDLSKKEQAARKDPSSTESLVREYGLSRNKMLPPEGGE